LNLENPKKYVVRFFKELIIIIKKQDINIILFAIFIADDMVQGREGKTGKVVKNYLIFKDGIDTKVTFESWFIFSSSVGGKK